MSKLRTRKRVAVGGSACHSCGMSVVASGLRLGWEELPEHVRRGVEDIVGGGRVVSASSQPGGFSPGTADRIVTASGRRAFVKAASPVQNPDTPSIHRTEARVVADLPPSRHLPSLLGTYDDGRWVAAVFADIDGRMPTVPWLPADVEATATALHAIAEIATPNPVPGLHPLATAFAPQFGGWDRIRQARPDVLDDWAREHVDLLCDLAARGLAALAGSSLVHGDTRADNLIVCGDRPADEDGEHQSPAGEGSVVVVVDWPWACEGAAWFDLLCLCVNVDLHGADPEPLVARYLHDVDPDDLTAALAGLSGYFVDAARLPPPAGLPTVRGFQAAQGASTLRWVRRRVETAAAISGQDQRGPCPG